MISNKNFEIYFDCGLSKIRGIAVDKSNEKNNFCFEKKYFSDPLILDSNIQEIVNNLEKKTNEYLDEANLMIDSSNMLSIGISILKNFDGLKLKKKDIQFLIRDAKQQILRNYADYNITHIIIENYKIDNIDHPSFPDNINCNLLSIDINFICLPKKIINFFKSRFFKLTISINQIYCSSYVKSENYMKNYSHVQNITFIDIGFNKTSIISYNNNVLNAFNVLPLGGNNITQDLSKVLDLDLQNAEEIKLSFDLEGNFFNKTIISVDLIRQIISARIEEILNLCIKSIKLNNNFEQLDQTKILLIGEGSRVLNNKIEKKISLLNNMDLIDETLDNISESVTKFNLERNKQEVVIVPKKQINRGFFEKLFHFFK